MTKLQLSEGTYSWIHIKDTWSVHLFNGDYLSIPEGTGSCGYLFHEIPCMSYSVWICSFRDLAAVKWSEVFKQFQHLRVFIKFNNFLLIHFNHSYIFSIYPVNIYSWFHIKGTWSVHSSNGDYLSIPEVTGCCGYLFHEILSIYIEIFTAVILLMLILLLAYESWIIFYPKKNVLFLCCFFIQCVPRKVFGSAVYWGILYNQLIWTFFEVRPVFQLMFHIKVWRTL